VTAATTGLSPTDCYVEERSMTIRGVVVADIDDALGPQWARD
jgi:hypothetical protein